MPDIFRSRNPNIDDEAIAWLARMGGNPAAGEREAFAQWCSRSPAHRRALARANLLLEDIGHTQAASDHRQLLQVMAPRRQRGLNRRALLVGGVSAAALAGVGILGMGNMPIPGEQRTATGERRSLLLPDGSRAWLNTASSVALAFTGARRQLLLKAGEVFVDVAAAGTPLFEVMAPAGTLSTRVARFTLRQQATGCLLTVLSGEVTVKTPAATAHVTGNRSLQFGAGGITAPQPVDAEAASAWVRGKLVFNQQPMHDIADEMERYLQGQVVIVGQYLRRLRLSGVFELDDLEALPRTIAALAGAQLLQLPLLTVIG